MSDVIEASMFGGRGESFSPGEMIAKADTCAFQRDGGVRLSA